MPLPAKCLYPMCRRSFLPVSRRRLFPAEVCDGLLSEGSAPSSGDSPQKEITLGGLHHPVAAEGYFMEQ